MSASPSAQRHVFLDPDGSNPFGLAVVVFASTGVRYAVQCGGLATEQRSAEGFLVLCPSRDPVGCDPNEDLDSSFMSFFEKHFPGGVTPSWSEELVVELRNLVGRIVFWTTDPEGGDGRGYLSLDRSRLAECIEAWIPVNTGWGDGILVTSNSD